MPDEDPWQCWTIEPVEDEAPVAKIYLAFEGSEGEAQALAGDGRYVVRASDIEMVYQQIFSAHPSVRRIYSSRWPWKRD